MSPKKVLVAMSGGVDSSVAAYLLEKQGYEVAGATMRIWQNRGLSKDSRSCCSIDSANDARRVCQKLGIPHYLLNLDKEFKNYVIDYFKDEYVRGRTPNPCIVCNGKIKFDIFLEKALAMGFDLIATGHYANVGYSRKEKRYFLKQGKDRKKDQSYALFQLTQKQLGHLLLPLGKLTKNEIRRIAKRRGLAVHDKPDSQEICFIPDNDYAKFLRENFGVKDKEGLIKNQRGETLGKHKGFFHFTIGQRRGLNIAYSHALYVIKINPKKNEIIVGPKEAKLGKEFTVSGINWLVDTGRLKKFEAFVKIRYAHKRAKAKIEKLSRGKARVKFLKPQESITPGQAAVFYKGDRVLGGGWID